MRASRQALLCMRTAQTLTLQQSTNVLPVCNNSVQISSCQIVSLPTFSRLIPGSQVCLLTHPLPVFTALIAACQQQPAPGSKLSLSGSLFSQSPIVITTPTPSLGSVYYSPPHAGPLSLNAMIGIIVGAVMFLLALSGFFVVCCGKRRRRAHLTELARRRDSYTSLGPNSPKCFRGNGGGLKWAGGSRASTVPMAQDISPDTPYGSEKHNFSPYSSKYSSPVSARDALNLKSTWEWPQPQPSMPMPGAFELEKMREQRVYARDFSGENEGNWEGHGEGDRMKPSERRGFTVPPLLRLPGSGRGG